MAEFHRFGAIVCRTHPLRPNNQLSSSTSTNRHSGDTPWQRAQHVVGIGPPDFAAQLGGRPRAPAVGPSCRAGGRRGPRPACWASPGRRGRVRFASQPFGLTRSGPAPMAAVPLPAAIEELSPYQPRSPATARQTGGQGFEEYVLATWKRGYSGGTVRACSRESSRSTRRVGPGTGC